LISQFEGYREFIPDFQVFLESIKRPMPVHIRINSLKAEPSSQVVLLGERGIYLKPSIKGNNYLFDAPGLKSPGSLLEYLIGYLNPQALTSCLAAVALSPRPSSYVLDICAAPGGKTSHLAQIMK
jgi:16S rRNA C967 or C1407 C5-methylase (RsmB/RsmF family)